METLTFLFTDIEGSTSMLERVGHDVYIQVLADHHRLIRAAITAHAGKEIGTQGDGFFAVFSSASACAAAAIQIQLALSAHRWPASEQVRVRMGLHSGEASETSTGLVGFDVHRAARVAGVANGGQILLSETAAALARHGLSGDASLQDLGLHRLKDLGRAERIFQLTAKGLPDLFPTLRSLDNPELINNLPAQLGPFIGRERELAEVTALVGSTRLVTLTGAGGAGKTRLALHVAAELLDGSADGVWLVELAAVAEADAVVPSITEALSIAGQPGRSPVDCLLDALRHQSTLIVLDNCEHLIGACARVTESILRNCAKVHLMATSREPLGINGETIYRVPSLSLPSGDDTGAADGSDAVALFAERAREQGVGFVLDDETAPHVVSICRRLDGMPLAIELAAARLRSLSVARLSERLDQRFRLLTGGSRNAMPRQQTLHATVQWSYSLLSDPEQSVLRRLAVFVDGFDLDAAEAVCPREEREIPEITDLLGSLVDKSLVVAEPQGQTVRYRLLETIRQFASESLVESNEGGALDARAAHCAHFLAVAEATAPHLTGTDQGQWLKRLDADQANLWRAIEHAAADPAETHSVLRFAAAMRRYWWARSPREQVLRLLVPVLERPEAQTQPRLLVSALCTAGRVACSVDIRLAQRLSEQAIELARGLDDDRLLVSSLWVRCAVCFFAGDTAKALPFAEECVETARLIGDDGVLGESLSALLFCTELIDPTRAEGLFNEAIACIDRTGDRFLAAGVQNNAAVFALRAGNLVRARDLVEQALANSEAAGVSIYHLNRPGVVGDSWPWIIKDGVHAYRAQCWEADDASVFA